MCGTGRGCSGNGAGEQGRERRSPALHAAGISPTFCDTLQLMLEMKIGIAPRALTAPAPPKARFPAVELQPAHEFLLLICSIFSKRARPTQLQAVEVRQLRGFA